MRTTDDYRTNGLLKQLVTLVEYDDVLGSGAGTLPAIGMVSWYLIMVCRKIDNK